MKPYLFRQDTRQRAIAIIEAAPKLPTGQSVLPDNQHWIAERLGATDFMIRHHFGRQKHRHSIGATAIETISGRAVQGVGIVVAQHELVHEAVRRETDDALHLESILGQLPQLDREQLRRVQQATFQLINRDIGTIG